MRFQNPKLKMQTRCAYNTTLNQMFAKLRIKAVKNHKINIGTIKVKYSEDKRQR